MGFVGGLGTYKSIEKVTKSDIISAASIFLYALNYRQTYYFQEAAEYCLMLGLIPWIIFYFLDLVESPTKKNIKLMVVYCVLAVYSQYGAVFPVIAVLFLSFVYVLYTKSRELIFYIIREYVGAFLFTAVPLWVFFLKKQMERQGSSLKMLNHFRWNEFVENTKQVFEWNMITSVGASGRIMLVLVGILMLVFALTYMIIGKLSLVKYLLAANLICYMLYYLCTIWGAYAAGTFGVRYNVFLIPLWFITGIILLYQLVISLRTLTAFSLLKSMSYLIEGMVIVMLVCYGYTSWSSLSANWQKEDNRGLVKAWLEQECYTSDTLIYYGASMPFCYYLQHNEKYNPDMENKIIYQQWDRDQTVQYYQEYYDTVYGVGEWPKDLYLGAVHYRDDLNTMLEPFLDADYIVQDTYSGYGARLIHVFK